MQPRRAFLSTLAQLLAPVARSAAAPPLSPTASIAVFGLFHPRELWVRTANGTARFRSTTGLARLAPDDFVLIVPGQIERRFRGALEIRPTNNQLLAVVTMDLETAVASVVAAESVPAAPDETLKAQAIVARSFYLASGRRHSAFHFCDTTHCQFLRACPALSSPANRAAQATRGLALAYRNRAFAPFYSAACGGHTRSLGGLHNISAEQYPYFAVNCDYCLKHPGEPVRGHRLGMCQLGAAAMARAGATFSEILNRYYPATTVEPWPAGTSQTPSKLT